MSATDPELEAVVPILSVRDLPTALEFYRGVLGFQLGWSWGSPPTRASVCREGVELNLVQDGKEAQAGPSRVYFQGSGIEAYYAAIQQAGASIAVPLADRPYGMKDFTVEDPDGNQLSFGEALGG